MDLERILKTFIGKTVHLKHDGATYELIVDDQEGELQIENVRDGIVHIIQGTSASKEHRPLERWIVLNYISSVTRV